MESLASTQSSANLPQTQAANVPATQGLDLHDIHLPEQINDYPIALGWWLLAAVVIACIVFALMKYYQHRQFNRSKKIALTQLKTADNLSQTDIIGILKWTAMQYFPRTALAKLYGEQFQYYLSKQLAQKYQAEFMTLTEQAFANQYLKSADGSADTSININNEENATNQAKQGAVLWLNKALPPKMPTSSVAANSTEEDAYQQGAHS